MAAQTAQSERQEMLPICPKCGKDGIVSSVPGGWYVCASCRSNFYQSSQTAPVIIGDGAKSQSWVRQLATKLESPLYIVLAVFCLYAGLYFSFVVPRVAFWLFSSDGQSFFDAIAPAYTWTKWLGGLVMAWFVLSFLGVVPSAMAGCLRRPKWGWRAWRWW